MSEAARATFQRGLESLRLELPGDMVTEIRGLADALVAEAVAEAVRAGDIEHTAGPCRVMKIDETDWELWCENPGTGARPNGRYRLAGFASPAECRAVCNALNRVHANALTGETA